MELPFKSIGYGEERDKYDNKVENIKKEENLNEEQIKNILLEHLNKTKLKITFEKNVKGINENPFDVIVGDEEQIQLYGFEIKGDTDSFTRLKDQLRAYLFTFEQVYLVLHKKKKPDWLPYDIGIIRIFENKDIYIESHSYIEDPFNISTEYEWDTLFKCNGLGNTSKRTKEVLELIGEIRKNVLFNRFFAISSGLNSHTFEKFYPFTDKQKTILIGFDVPYHYKLLLRDTTELEKRFENLKKACMLGQKGLKEFGRGGK